MDLSFLVPSRPFPVGGVLAMYEYAHALLDLGHRVRLVHVDGFGVSPTPPEELAHLVTFDPRLDHEVIDGFTGELNGADAVFCFDERIPTDALPLMWVQSAGILAWEQEHAIYAARCPKLCGSSWLRHVAHTLGNPAEMLVTALPGLDHERFRHERPLDDRPRRALMAYGAHPAKGAVAGIRALRQVRREIPDFEATLFGTSDPPAELPAWITYLRDPPQPTRAGIYNGHRCFVISSLTEGFGMTGIEAQSCGTPLVASANGGSADYANADIDALVAPPGDVEALATQIIRALTDDDLAQRLSDTGRETARRFTWAKSALEIDDLLRRYASDPDAFRQPVAVPENPTAAGYSIARMRQDFYAAR
ncbi:MAG: hypothetical protein DHS20C19_04860 [Acidimicrobiales bacterium]|nr:MAG: hypothetical protein DHS20C19_04860 [Acidimicrobiales bacterium]